MTKSSNVHSYGKLRKVQSPADNFGLSEPQFIKYTRELKMGSDSFIEEVMANQLPESMSYLKHKLKISHEEAYDICIDTFFRV